jgi:protein-S-isoprenylcysteine O-methyltransferase Ste14
MTAPWWRGARGEWYVIAQFALLALMAAGPRTFAGLPPFPWLAACRMAGATLMGAGSLLALAASVRLGRSLTPLPYPRDGATLAQSGPYAIVRHPIYSGVLLLAFGWALYAHGWLTVAEAAALFVLLDFKSRREERWLAERFTEYAAYQRRVRKLIPCVY